MVDPIQSQSPIKPDQIFDILIRRKWILIIPLCISLTAGLFFTLTATKTYEASTFILVQPQRVPTQYVQSVVTSTIGQRINTISQQILSRSNLEKVIDQFGLYENSESMYLEDKIASMRKRVKVKIERTRSRSRSADAFSIGFSGSDPQKVMRIANTLASYFMDENLKVREAQAVGTSEFLDSELEKTRKRLEERERNLAEYRAKYLGGLPDELESNLRTLDRLQLQLTNKYTTMSEAKTALALLETELSKKRELLAEQQNNNDETENQPEIGTSAFSQSEDEKKLEAVQNEYDTMLLKYTPKHPDVMKLQKVIEKLETSIKEAKAEEQSAEKDTSQDTANNETDDQAKIQILQSELKIKQGKAEIKQIQNDIVKIEQQMKIYQQRVEETPKREQELKMLQRDYSNINEIYNSLLARQLESEISVNMEKKQKGEQFRILDHARLPEKPISPNVKKLFLLSLAVGLGVGCGIVLLLELFDNSIRHDEQIEKGLGLNIIATIPVMKVSGKKIKDKFELLFFIGCALYASVFIAFFIVLNSKGLDRTVNWIKMTINL